MSNTHEIVIIGAGAAGIATAASLLKRKPDLDIAMIDPAEYHYYQPGWTMVGGGIFNAEQTKRSTSSVIPKGVKWLQAAATSVEAEKNQVTLKDGEVISYQYLIVCPGLKLDWASIEGLVETLGKNGVTSNYRYDLAPYTWDLVKQLDSGKVIFTQPPMPIKCAGAPQKAMYLSADYWQKKGCLADINISFCNAIGALFGVKDYVPALMEYVDSYGIALDFNHNLIKVDGAGKKAWFNKTDGEGNSEIIEREFDMLHVVPPQIAPDFIRESQLVDAKGWVDVDQATLRHKTFENIYSLGDVMNTPNAKTAAAARVQASIVASNLAADMGHGQTHKSYNGYGACPLTVENGKIVLAEFGFGGKLLPTFPGWLLNGTRPSKVAWWLKKSALPWVYWNVMLKGREWLLSKDKS